MAAPDNSFRSFHTGWASILLVRATAAVLLFALVSGLAEQRFTHACHASARAATAWFVLRYIAWQRRGGRDAATMLSAARKALLPDWKPRGAVLEGDVKRRMYNEAGFLNVFAGGWDGSTAPERAYAPLDGYLRRFR